MIRLVVGYADGGGDVVTVFQGQGADGGAEPIGDELGVGKVESVEDDDELLTAVAADGLRRSRVAAGAGAGEGGS